LSGGLWSVSRGLARRRDKYYEHYERLDAADAPRQGDLDGRGNLSDKELRRWCEWFVGICEDQVSNIGRMFHLDGMKTRIQALISFRAAHDKRIRPEAALPLYHLFLAGPTARGEFQQMTGLGERCSRTSSKPASSPAPGMSPRCASPSRSTRCNFCCLSFTRKRLAAKSEHAIGGIS
jgi:hypothetical protein